MRLSLPITLRALRAGRLRRLMALLLCSLWLPLALGPLAAPDVAHTHGGIRHHHRGGGAAHEHLAPKTTGGKRSLYQIALGQQHDPGHSHGHPEPDSKDNESPEAPALLWIVFTAHAALAAPALAALPVAAAVSEPLKIAAAIPSRRPRTSCVIRGPPGSGFFQHV